MVVPIRPLRLGPFGVTSTDGTVLLRVLPQAEVADATPAPYKPLFTVTTQKGAPLVHCDEACATH
eukprot:2563066-Alexandrium_andersonii.AAC.1